MAQKVPKVVLVLLEIQAQVGQLVKRESLEFLDCRDIQEDRVQRVPSDSQDFPERMVRKE